MNMKPSQNGPSSHWKLPVMLGSLGVLGVAFLSLVLQQTWYWMHEHIVESSDQQAHLAVAFNDAIRDHIAAYVRPELERRIEADEFIPEAMSTSCVARRVFEQVNADFSDYILRFPSMHPRNPSNLATADEAAIID